MSCDVEFIYNAAAGVTKTQTSELSNMMPANEERIPLGVEESGSPMPLSSCMGPAAGIGLGKI